MVPGRLYHFLRIPRNHQPEAVLLPIRSFEAAYSSSWQDHQIWYHQQIHVISSSSLTWAPKLKISAHLGLRFTASIHHQPSRVQVTPFLCLFANIFQMVGTEGVFRTNFQLSCLAYPVLGLTWTMSKHHNLKWLWYCHLHLSQSVLFSLNAFDLELLRNPGEIIQDPLLPWWQKEK